MKGVLSFFLSPSKTIVKHRKYLFKWSSTRAIGAAAGGNLANRTKDRINRYFWASLAYFWSHVYARTWGIMYCSSYSFLWQRPLWPGVVTVVCCMTVSKVHTPNQMKVWNIPELLAQSEPIRCELEMMISNQTYLNRSGYNLELEQHIWQNNLIITGKYCA